MPLTAWMYRQNQRSIYSNHSMHLAISFAVRVMMTAVLTTAPTCLNPT